MTLVTVYKKIEVPVPKEGEPPVVVLRNAGHLLTRLANTLEIDEPMNGDSRCNVQLEGIDVKPWPRDTVTVLCNICALQPCGSDFQRILTIIGGGEQQKMVSKPIVPCAVGHFNHIEIKMVTMGRNNAQMDIDCDAVTVQFSINTV
jgi:hypothetical protein